MKEIFYTYFFEASSYKGYLDQINYLVYFIKIYKTHLEIWVNDGSIFNSRIPKYVLRFGQDYIKLYI